MISALKGVIAPLMALTLFLLGATYFSTFNVLYLKSKGSTDFFIGILQASYYLGMLVGSYSSGSIIARIGHVRLFGLASAVGAISVLMMGCCSSLWLWMFMRLLLGCALAYVYVIVESWVLTVSSEAIRGRMFAIYMVVIYLAQSSSQHFLAIDTAQEAVPFMIVGVLLAAASLPLSTSSSCKCENTSVSVLSTGITLLRLAPMGMFAGVLSGVILGSFYSFAPLFAAEQGISVALWMNLGILGGVAFQWPLGKLSDRIDREWLLIITTLFVITIALLIAFSSGDSLHLLPLGFLFGGGAFTIFPQSVVSIVSRAPEVNVIAVTALQSVVYSLGCILGPLAVPFFTSYFDSAGLYVLIASVTSLLTLFGLFSIALNIAPAHPTAEG